MTVTQEAFAVHHKAWVPAGVTLAGDPAPGTGALLGKQLEPRYLAKLIYEAGWNDLFCVMVTLQVELAESQGFTHAIHVNRDGTRDRGVFQLNSIHAHITDEIAYDPVLATAEAFKLYLGRGSGWEDWAAYTSGVFLHDSYVGRAARGLGNYIADDTLKLPVPDWAGKPYTHRFTSPVLDFEHRLQGVLRKVAEAKKDLGFAAASRTKVDAIQHVLSDAQAAARPGTPT